MIKNLPKHRKTAKTVKNLFKDYKRIKKVQIFGDSAVITFQSNSAARKTFETLHSRYLDVLDIY